MSAMLRIDYEDGHEVFVDMKVHLVRYKVEWPQYVPTVRRRWSLHYPFYHKKEELYLTKGYIMFYFSNGDNRMVTYSDRKNLINAIKQIESALKIDQSEVMNAHQANVSHSSSNSAYS